LVGQEALVSDPIWTADDLATLKAAIVSGVLTVRYSGPPAREITYQSLAAMRELLAEMRREVNAPAVRSRLAVFRKGL
jgi:hypothetical protein